MDLETVADELYQASPDEFVQRRKSRADEARAAKDRPLVKAIGELRRPTRSAWLVNLLAHESAPEVTALLELGAALGDAQRRGSGADLRRLSRERQATLDRLTREAAARGVEHGHTATETTRQEVSQTLQAALADPAVAELVRTGRVVQPASYGGFGPLDLSGALPAATVPEDAALEDQTPGTVGPGEPPTSEAAAARAEAERVLEAARAAFDAAREEAGRAEADAEQATTDADELAERVEALRHQLEEAEEQERRAGQTARAARKRSSDLQQVAAEAEQRAAAAQRDLDDLGATW